MKNKEFFVALEDLEREKGIKQEVFLQALETALVSACKKHYGEATNVSVVTNPENHTIRVFKYKNIVEEVEDSDKQISLADAQLIKKSYKIGDTVADEIVPKEFGRIAAQTAKQVIMQRLKENEREQSFSEFSEKEDQIITGIIRRVEAGSVFIDLGKGMEGVLMTGDQIANEKYEIGERIKVYVKKVKNATKGAQVIVSRAAAGLVKRMFENEVPEIRSGLVLIKSIVREAGYRTKMAVESTDPSIDAVGACIGGRGTRINAIVAELNGEKVDIIEWSADALEFIARAISPAKALMVQVNDTEHSAKVIVPDDKLSLAIGRDGQNARLAARLTGWKIDVRSLSVAQSMPEFAGQLAPHEGKVHIGNPSYEEDDIYTDFDQEDDF